MTHRPIRTEADGTRVYADGHRYRPKAHSERKNAVRKPSEPGAVRFGGAWYLPLQLLPDAARALPETREDSEAYDHMPAPCGCDVCTRGPEIVGRWQRRWLRDHGLRPKKISREAGG